MRTAPKALNFRASRDEFNSALTAGKGAEAICSSARVGVGEGAEACSFINFGRPVALLGSSVAFGSGCG